MQTRCEPVAFGHVDAFVSHSHRDPAPLKLAALQAWAGRQRARSGIAPRVWLDLACGDEGRHVLANLPVALAGCRTLLVLAGDTWLSRLWCLLEVFTWLQLGRPASTIVVVPLTATSLEGLDTLQPEEAECDDPKQREAMLSLVEASFGDLSAIAPVLQEAFEASGIKAPQRRASSSALDRRASGILGGMASALGLGRASSRATSKERQTNHSDEETVEA